MSIQLGADLEMDAGDIEDLIDELEDLSDSGPEMDTLSVTSTPKPSLRPFFASSRSLAPDPVASLNTMEANLVRNEGYGRLERHYSDESSKRAPTDSDSHAEVWTDQEQSDTPTTTTTTALSASSPPKQSQEDKTKVFYYLISNPSSDQIRLEVKVVLTKNCGRIFAQINPVTR